MKNQSNENFSLNRGEGGDPSVRVMNGAQAKRRRSSGVALLIVLGMLVLLSMIVVAFLTSVTTDLGDSKGYEYQAQARVLADSAVNLVIGEIRVASTGTGVAWVSQPGLIRTYDTTGNAVKAYKLYSSGSMIVDEKATGTFDPNSGVDLPSGTIWANQPNLWTDINSPVASNAGGSTAQVFPIIDGNGMKALTINGTAQYTYTTDGVTQDIQGFYATVPATTGSYNPNLSVSATNNPVPMPVQWLYMLKDGTLLSATAIGATKDVGMYDPNGALTSGTNPIVARIAFWTDDESAKVNINTAAEGTFWDTPVCNTQASTGTSDFNNDLIYEYDLALNKADSNEFQRYPGHPATTCLSPILGSYVKTNLFGSNLTTLTGSQRAQFVEAFNQIAPRITGSDATGHDYSSHGGTQNGGANNQAPGDNGFYPITNDTDRLYATEDELIYNLNRNLQTTLSGSVGDPRPLVQKAKFFLTASSKSPETNLFNLPRVAIWPITKPIGSLDTPSDTSKMTAFDQLIAFCSTVRTTVNGSTSTRAFYFTRADPKSATYDMISGSRNQAVYKYLSTLLNTSHPIPGFGGTFAAKYPAGPGGILESNQILTEIFDYIRTTNLVDTSSDPIQPTMGAGYNASSAGLNGGPSTAYTTPGPVKLGVSSDFSCYTTRGQVVPIMPATGSGSFGGTKGGGRILTISEMAMSVQQPSGTDVPPKNTYVQVVLIPNMYSSSAGFSALSNDLRIHFANIKMAAQKSGTGDATWHTLFSGTDNGVQPSGSYADIYNTGRLGQQQSDESKLGGPVGAKILLEPPDAEGNGSPTDSMWPASQVAFTGTFSGTDSVTIGGVGGSGSATFDVQILAPGTSGSGTIIQTFSFAFPKTTMPIPPTLSQFLTTSGSKALCAFGGSDAGGAHGYNQFSRSWIIFGTGSVNAVRSLAPLGLQYDMRTIACSSTIPATVFYPVGSGSSDNYTTGPYFDKAALLVHSFRKGSLNRGGDADEGQQPMQGSLIKGPTVTWTTGMTPLAFSAVTPVNFENGSDIHTRPIVPAGVNGVFNTNGDVGDWDNGPHFMSDGSYLNKPDEGTNLHTAQGGGFQGVAPYIGYYWVSEDATAQPVTLFSPNRQVPSPVAFGSLPTGVMRSKQWQTLLFRPAKPYLPGGISHPGAGVAAGGGQSPASGAIPYAPYTTPPDHLLLDLFWMPIVEPYPISEPFATSGKINMNYQIAPFTYIRRDTGLRAVLSSVKITALDPNHANLASTYKVMGNQATGQGAGGGGGIGTVIRRNIDIDSTLEQLDWRFSQNQPFRSASEICDIPLIPTSLGGYTNVSLSPQSTSSANLTLIDGQLATFWNCNSKSSYAGQSGNWLTGDNSLERPYSLIYPRLTTRSNTYTIHVRVQSLKKASSTAYNIFKDGQDQVTGEFRGSFLIERYLDPNNTGFAVGSGTVSNSNNELTFAASLGQYKFRIVSSKQFTP